MPRPSKGRTFSCDNCHSASITISGELTNDADVHCARCNSHLGSWGVFRENIERRLRLSSHDPVEQDARVEIA
jgi:hypothetical protein